VTTQINENLGQGGRYELFIRVNLIPITSLTLLVYSADMVCHWEDSDTVAQEVYANVRRDIGYTSVFRSFIKAPYLSHILIVTGYSDLRMHRFRHSHRMIQLGSLDRIWSQLLTHVHSCVLVFFSHLPDLPHKSVYTLFFHTTPIRRLNHCMYITQFIWSLYLCPCRGTLDSSHTFWLPLKYLIAKTCPLDRTFRACSDGVTRSFERLDFAY